jgi:hypothetical protein
VSRHFKSRQHFFIVATWKSGAMVARIIEGAIK